MGAQAVDSCALVRGTAIEAAMHLKFRFFFAGEWRYKAGQFAHGLSRAVTLFTQTESRQNACSLRTPIVASKFDREPTVLSYAHASAREGLITFAPNFLFAVRGFRL